MRKKNMSYKSDLIMWYFIYLLPLIIFAISCIRHDVSDVFTYYQTTFLTGMSSNVIYTAINQIFGSDPNAILPLFTGNWNFIIYYATYFIGALLIHLCVDFLAFIPRLAHKWLDCLTKTEE